MPACCMVTWRMLWKQRNDVSGRPTTVTRATLMNRRQTGSRSTSPAAIVNVSDVTASGYSQPEPETFVFVAVASRVSARLSMAPTEISQWTRRGRDLTVVVDADTSAVDRFAVVFRLWCVVTSRPMTEPTKRTSTTKISPRHIVTIDKISYSSLTNDEFVC